ncbi:MAG: HAD family phosphatase [Bacteroidia bacterium]
MQKENNIRIKNIILDLGGVIFDVSYEAAANAYIKLGIKNFDELFSKKKQEHFFDDYEKGIISDEDFRNEIRKHISTPVTDGQIDDAWNALLFTIPAARMKFVQSLKKHYNLFLLSNTNGIHLKEVKKILEKDFGKNVLESVFKKMYFSCELKMRKPETEIFNFVVQGNNLKKEETIFIDDSIQHVEGAKKAGLPAFHLDLSKNTLETFLPEILAENFKL